MVSGFGLDREDLGSFFRPGASPSFSYHMLVVNLGEAVLRFREFISFSGINIYPEYLIAYRRV